MEQTSASSTTRSNAGLSNALFHELKSSIRGDIFRPNDPLFTERSKMFNGNVLCTAKAVASPLDAVDVSKIILFCREHNLSPSVKAGGYGTAGWAVNGDIIIDLSRLRDIDIEPPRHYQLTDEASSSEGKAPLPWTSLEDTPTGGSKGKGKAVVTSPPSEAQTNINTKPISLTSTILTSNSTSITSNKRRRSPSPSSSAPHHQSSQSTRDMDGDVSMFSSSSQSTVLNPALQAFLFGPALSRNPSEDDPNGDGYDEPRRPPAHKRKITTVEDDRIEREKAKEREREKDVERAGTDSLLPEQAERQTSTGSKKSTDSGFGSLGSPSESTSNMSTSTSKGGSGSGSGLMSTSGSGGSGSGSRSGGSAVGTGTGTEEASNTSTKATTPEQDGDQEGAGTIAGGGPVQPSISRAASEFGYLGLGLGGGGSGATHGSMYASGAGRGGSGSDPFGYMTGSGGHSSFASPLMWSGPPGTAGHEHYSPSMSGTPSGVGGGSVSDRLMNMADPFAPTPSFPSAPPRGGAIENRMVNVSGWVDRNASAMSGAPDPFGYMSSETNLGVGGRSSQAFSSLAPGESSHSRGSTPTPTEVPGTRAGGSSASRQPLASSQFPAIAAAASASSTHASSSSSSHLTSSHTAPVHPPSQLGSGVGEEGGWGGVEPLYKEAYVTFGAGVMAKEVDLWTAEHPLEGKEGGSSGGNSRKVVYHVPFAAHPVGSSIMLLGGFGFLSRLHGLSIDNLVEVEMVLADGRIVVVNEREYPDLWWGIRGAGPTFGVATRYKARAHPIPVVFAGNLIYRFHRATAPSLIRHFRDCVKGAPRELYANVLLTAGPADKDSLVVVQICYVGPKEKGKEFLEAISAWSGERCLLNEVDEKSFLCQQDSVAQVLRAKAGRQWFIRSALVTSLPDDVISQTVTSFADTPIGCTWLFELAGGAIADYEDTCMPKSQREAAFTVAALHQWDMGINDPRCVETAEEWFKDTIAAVSTGGPIPSFLGRAEPPSRVMASYGKNWPRLVELKKKYDPQGMFRNTFWPLAEDAHTVIGPSEHEPRTAQEGKNGEGVNDI